MKTLSSKIVQFPAEQSDHETLLTSGQTFFQRLLTDISQAKHRIDLETYIFAHDHIGEQLAAALIRAKHRGVQVRVLVDGVGTPHWSSSYAKRLEAHGIETKIFHPFPWQIWNWRRAVARIPRIMKWLYLILKVNSRNHRKVCLIDHRLAYIGSINICRDHLPNELGGSDWRDIAVRLADVDLDFLQQGFERAWNLQGVKERLQDVFQYVVRNPVIRLNDNRHRRRVLHKNLLKIMKRCHQRIWITNAYFVPDNVLLKTLRDAAETGVDVRILLPKKSNHFFMTWAQSSFYRSLLRAGVRIFEYLPSMLHAKTLILDDWMLVGSSNLNQRSLLHDLEVDVNIRSPFSKQLLENTFLSDLKQSQELTLNDTNSRPLRVRVLGRIMLYLKYWI